MLGQIKDCDAIRYAAYRTATKLDLLRSALRLDQVKLGAVTSAFHQHGFRSALTEERLNANKASDIVADIFFAAGKVRTYYSPTLDVSACAETALRAAFMVYGDNTIGVSFLKVFFVILCEARLRDKLAYFYKDFATPESGMLTRRGVTSLLTQMTKLPEFLGESNSFGKSLVEPAVSQCFYVSEARSQHLDEDSFFKWLFKEPQVIVWLPTFYRLVAAKSIRHNVRCANCRSHVIIGMRYQCLQCINYDLCQHCFFYGLVNRGHKVRHPMQEYCYRSTRKDATRAWFKTVANNMGLFYVKDGSRDRRKLFRRKPLQRRYLPHDPTFGIGLPQEKSPFPEKLHSMEMQAMQPNVVNIQAHQEEACSSGFHSVSSSSHSPVGEEPKLAQNKDVEEDRQDQLNSILMHMERENAAVLERLTHLQSSKPTTPKSPRQKVDNTNLLSQPIDSCVAMQAQLDRLKRLMDGIFGGERHLVTATNETDKPNYGVNANGTPLRTKKQIMEERHSILLELQNSLAHPSLIESTPVVTMNNRNHLKNNSNVFCVPGSAHQLHKKKLSRLALDNNFSPIVFQVPKTPNNIKIGEPKPVPPPVFDESLAVESMLNGESESVVDGSKTKFLLEDGPNTPNLSKVTLGDLTSLLAKTGHHQTLTDQELNITQQLAENDISNAAEGVDEEGDIMEELEHLMLRLEDVFATFRDPSLIKKSMPIMTSSGNLVSATETDPAIIGQIVAEISDQIHAAISHHSKVQGDELVVPAACSA